jgi:hypothetical protein
MYLDAIDPLVRPQLQRVPRGYDTSLMPPRLQLLRQLGHGFLDAAHDW